MIGFDKIQNSINLDFDIYMNEFLNENGEKRKYYYWSLDFFETIGRLTYGYFKLTHNQKEIVNERGKQYFDEKEKVIFLVSNNSRKNDLSIKNYSKLFTFENKTGQELKKEYITEYVFWKILEKLSEIEGSIGKNIAEKQKKNFLLTYIDYLISNNKTIPYNNHYYIKYTNLKQGYELMKRLSIIDKKKQINNKILRNKIENLYVLNDMKSSIYFVFSPKGGKEKEELRELLDIMGKDTSETLYRGQANSFWKLDSSMTREKKYIKNENQLYYDILSLKPDSFKNDHTVYERLITMQHYGMPTRLLDITRNPLVAIFFACNNKQYEKHDGNIFTFTPSKEDFLNFEDKRLKCLTKIIESIDVNTICIDCEKYNSCRFIKKNEKATNSNNLPDIFLKNWFVRGVAKNQRINSQSGDFIFVGLKDSNKQLSNLLNKTIIIDSDSKKTLIEQLETLNIHGGSVYPDITHMSNYITNKYLNHKDPNKNQRTNDRCVIDNINKDSNKAVDLESKNDNSNLEKIFSNLVKLQLINLHKKNLKGISNLEERNNITRDFDSRLFWNEDKMENLKEFAQKEKLNSYRLKDLINNYIISDKTPIRDVVFDLMKNKPNLKERKLIIDEMVSKIKLLINRLYEEDM